MENKSIQIDETKRNNYKILGFSYYVLNEHIKHFESYKNSYKK